MLANPVTRSTGVGPSLSDDDEVPEVLGQDSDTSSSDDTVLSHAQELVSRGPGGGGRLGAAQLWKAGWGQPGYFTF